MLHKSKLSDIITIVVPCKNEENYIHNLLNSLRAQDIDNTRIIIADCSTDNTRQVIKDNSRGLNVEIIQGKKQRSTPSDYSLHFVYRC